MGNNFLPLLDNPSLSVHSPTINLAQSSRVSANIPRADLCQLSRDPEPSSLALVLPPLESLKFSASRSLYITSPDPRLGTPKNSRMQMAPLSSTDANLPPPFNSAESTPVVADKSPSLHSISYTNCSMPAPALSTVSAYHSASTIDPAVSAGHDTTAAYPTLAHPHKESFAFLCNNTSSKTNFDDAEVFFPRRIHPEIRNDQGENKADIIDQPMTPEAAERDENSDDGGIEEQKMYFGSYSKMSSHRARDSPYPRILGCSANGYTDARGEQLRQHFDTVDSGALMGWGNCKSNGAGPINKSINARGSTLKSSATSRGGRMNTTDNTWGDVSNVSEAKGDNGWGNTKNKDFNAFGGNIDDGQVFDAKPYPVQPLQGHLRARHQWSTLTSVRDQPHSYSQAYHRDLVASPDLSSRNEDYEQRIEELTLKLKNQKKKTASRDCTIEHNVSIIDEIRDQNKIQADLITKLQLRNVVLETELEHAAKSTAEANNATVIVAQTLSSAFAAFSRSQVESPREVVEELDQDDGENQRIRREHRALKEQIERLLVKLREFDELLRREHKAQENTSENDVELPLTSIHTPVQNPLYAYMPGGRHDSSTLVVYEAAPRLSAMEKGKGQQCRSQESFSPSITEFAEKKWGCGKGLRNAYKQDKALALQQDAVQDHDIAKHTKTQNENDEIPEIRSPADFKGVCGWNEPIIETSAAANSLALDLSLDSGATVHKLTNKLRTIICVQDVGLESLDDILANDKDGHLLGKNKGGEEEKEEEEEEEEGALEVSTQLTTQMKEMISFENLPKPTILKTGFDMSVARRGEDYSNMAYPKVHLRGMDHFTRLDPSSTVNCATSELWQSLKDRQNVMQFHQSQVGRDRRMRYPDLFRYGIQYVPDVNDINFLRTVCISNIPPTIDLREVLARVRGGLVINAIYMDTRRLMGGSTSAMIIFAEDSNAVRFVDYTSINPITFSDGNNAQKACVSLVSTPTYPLNPGMKSCLLSLPKKTRCIAIYKFPQNVSLFDVERDLACETAHRADQLLEMYIDEQQTLHLQFAGIAAAGFAFATLLRISLYQGSLIMYEADPCSGALEELTLPLPSRPLMFPGHHRLSINSEKDLRTASESLVFEHTSRSQNPWARIGLDSARIEVNSARIEVDSVVIERKPILALSRAALPTPSFSGKGIMNSSWADEVIEEAESNKQTLPPESPIHLPLYDEYSKPNSELALPPTDTVDGIILDGLTSPAIKDTVKSIMTKDINVLMKEPGLLRNPLVGLSGSKYATAIPGFEDRGVGRTRHSALQNSFPETPITLTSSNHLSTSKERQSTINDYDPTNLLIAALDSSTDSDEAMKRSFGSDTPKVTQSRSDTSFPSPYERKSPSTPRYILAKPSFSPDCNPVQKSPTRASRYSEGHSTPLDDFNREQDMLECLLIPATPVILATIPGSAVRSNNNLVQQVPLRELAQDTEGCRHTALRAYYPAKGSVPEGEWTKEEIEKIKDSTPETRERYVKSIEMGRNVGESGGREDMIPELSLDFSESGGKGKVMEKVKINPDEIDLEMDDDDVDTGEDENEKDAAESSSSGGL